MFPSAAIAWRVSNEPFMMKQGVVSDLKIRSSFGVTGNDRIPPYQSLATTANTFYSGSSGSATLGISPNSLENAGLKWETTYQYDAGIDLTLWKDRINLTADVYLKQTKDLLLQADIPGQTGYMKQWQNLGQVDNRGLELAINTINLRTKNFTWSSNFNISFNRNEVVSLGSVNYIPVTITGSAISSVGRVIVGQPIGTAYGYVFDGIYQLSDFDLVNGAYVLKKGVTSIQGRVVKPGDFKYKDLSSDGIADNTKDYAIISNSNPLHFGGFANNFRYKDLELNILFQWSYGNDIINTGRYRYEAGGGYFANVTKDYWDNRWTNTNPSNKYAAVTAQGKTDISSYYVEDGSYLRLKNVTLSYTLKATPFFKKTGVAGCRFYVTGENLHTWTKYTGFDPELASYSPLLPGIDNIAYPRSRTFTIGFNVKF
jgi:TonB-linked SusC/RagA family outer membrane protein